tara:strand:+ start:1629 stop:3491 length:1863 start_codon:yes stop_codon:yes gene_type:complete
MPSVSAVELTNTFDDWRNRTNDIVTEINGANSVDPTSAIVYANSTSGFQVNEVVSDSVTGTLVTGTRLTFTGGNINFTSANTTSLGNVHQTHILGGTAIDVSSPSLADTSISNTFVYNSKINLNGQKFVSGAAEIDLENATVTNLGAVAKFTGTAVSDDDIVLTNPTVNVNSGTIGGITLSAGTHEFTGATVNGASMNTTTIDGSTVQNSNVVANGDGFLATTNCVSLAVDVGTANVGIGKFVEVSSSIGTEKKPTSSKGRTHIRTEYAAASDYANWDGSSGTLTSFAVEATADELVLEGNTSAGMTILANTVSNSHIAFGDGADPDVGGLIYVHNTDDLHVINDGANTAVFSHDNGGSLQIVGADTVGTSSGKLHINVGSSDGTTGLYMDSNDADQYAIYVEASQTTQNVVHVNSTTLTEGSAFSVSDNSPSAAGRKIVNIRQDHATATGGIALNVETDAMKAVEIVQNATDKIAMNVTASGVQTAPLVKFENTGDADHMTLYVKNSRTDGGLIAEFANNTTSGVLCASANGNIGINDTTPTYKLDVNGTLRSTGAVTLDSTLSVASGTTISSTLGVTSTATFTGGSGTTTVLGNSIVCDGVQCRLKVLDSDGTLINSG